MSAPSNMQTAFDRVRRYQELSRELLRATGDAPTLSPEGPPYEAQYGPPDLFQQSEELADIAGFYKAFGLAAPANERVDHLSVELEFMAFLALKEAWALNQGDETRVRELREVQTGFMTDHLGRWAPAFAARHEARGPELSSRLRDWIAEEVRTLGARPATLRPIDLRRAEDPDEPMVCGGGTCPIA